MYISLSEHIKNKILSDREKGVINEFAFIDENAVRRNVNPHDYPTVIRSNFIRDVDKIMNCPFFPRYQDKTQVFSLYKNDDITRRSLHVQFVSRIARTIGKALSLNLELIEAIALGHDIGHTPFGHLGEYALDRVLFTKTGKRFLHNVQSVRVLDGIFPYNVTLQTLDGILCHNGELELKEYRPQPLSGFSEFDERINKCVSQSDYSLKLVPSTLEGAVVRISDIIAYLGKDRQDAIISGVDNGQFTDGKIGSHNAEIINNLTVNVIENSYGKPYIALSDEYFDALKTAKRENYEKIYCGSAKESEIKETLDSAFLKVYEKMLADLAGENLNSPIYKHHIKVVERSFYKREKPYMAEDKNTIVCDYIASMTDDYFIDLYKKIFPNDKLNLEYVEYFN